MFKNEKGISGILLLLLAVGVLIGVFFYFKKIATVDAPADGSEAMMEEKRDSMEKEESAFDSLDEDEDTPEEIDNEVLEELDSLILDLEEDEEDLTDLEY